MDGSLIVALYAAIVATAGVIWQVILWRSERAGRLSVKFEASWSFPILQASVIIVNPNSYDVTLTQAGISLMGPGTLPLFKRVNLEAEGFTRTILARNRVEWTFDDEWLEACGSEYKISQAHFSLTTVLGHHQYCAVNVVDTTRGFRDRTKDFMKRSGGIGFGDLVRVRVASSDSVTKFKDKIGLVNGIYDGSQVPMLTVTFDDENYVKVPAADVELFINYDDRLKALK